MSSRVLALVLLIVSALGSDARAQALADTGGVFIGLRANGTEWSVQGIRAKTDPGVGLAILAGYGISDLYWPYAELTVASLLTDEEGTYGLVHIDGGIRFVLGGPLNTFRPYGEVALTIRRVEWQDPVRGRVEAQGMGGTVGGGLFFFLGPPVALDIGLKATFGGLDNVQFGFEDLPVELRARSLRLNVGFTLFLNR